MNAREIAAQLPPDEWTVVAEGDAFFSPQTRLLTRIERNTSLRVLAFDERDPIASSEAFVDDLLKAIGDHLCPQDEMHLVEKLAARLTKWQAESTRTEDWVGDSLRALLARHEATRG